MFKIDSKTEKTLEVSQCMFTIMSWHSIIISVDLMCLHKGVCANMLRIFICPGCYNFRIVSRKPDAVCFHCGTTLEKSELEYTTYMNMSETERDDYKENYKKRIKIYSEKLNVLFQKDTTIEREIHN